MKHRVENLLMKLQKQQEETHGQKSARWGHFVLRRSAALELPERTQTQEVLLDGAVSFRWFWKTAVFAS
jgi:hypothetical protein